MNIKYENSLDWFDSDDKSRVFQLFPKCFKDNRGYFMEVLKNIDNNEQSNLPEWLKTSNWIKQINRSSSSGGVIRGCHAQKGKFCQGKLVEAINEKIYDIITDVRPESRSFGTSSIFILDPEVHNKLWVPRGFLHSFVVPKNVKSDAIFEYFCDNVYNHESEIRVNPQTLLPDVVSEFKKLFGEHKDYEDLYNTFESENVYSEQDIKAMDYLDFVASIKEEYDKTGKKWYK